MCKVVESKKSWGKKVVMIIQHQIGPKWKKNCANRESNPGQMLGRHLCYHYTIGACLSCSTGDGFEQEGHPVNESDALQDCYVFSFVAKSTIPVTSPAMQRVWCLVCAIPFFSSRCKKTKTKRLWLRCMTLGPAHHLILIPMYLIYKNSLCFHD